MVSCSGETPANAATVATAPVQLGPLAIESQLAGDLEKPCVKRSVDAGCDLPDPNRARHLAALQVVTGLEAGLVPMLRLVGLSVA